MSVVKGPWNKVVVTEDEVRRGQLTFWSLVPLYSRLIDGPADLAEIVAVVGRELTARGGGDLYDVLDCLFEKLVSQPDLSVAFSDAVPQPADWLPYSEAVRERLVQQLVAMRDGTTFTNVWMKASGEYPKRPRDA